MFKQRQVLETLKKETIESQKAVEAEARKLLGLPEFKKYRDALLAYKKDIETKMRNMEFKDPVQYGVVQYVYNQKLDILGCILFNIEKAAGDA